LGLGFQGKIQPERISTKIHKAQHLQASPIHEPSDSIFCLKIHPICSRHGSSSTIITLTPEAWGLWGLMQVGNKFSSQNTQLLARMTKGSKAKFSPKEFQRKYIGLNILSSFNHHQPSDYIFCLKIHSICAWHGSSSTIITLTPEAWGWGLMHVVNKFGSQNSQFLLRMTWVQGWIQPERISTKIHKSQHLQASTISPLIIFLSENSSYLLKTWHSSTIITLTPEVWGLWGQLAAKIHRSWGEWLRVQGKIRLKREFQQKYSTIITLTPEAYEAWGWGLMQVGKKSLAKIHSSWQELLGLQEKTQRERISTKIHKAQHLQASTISPLIIIFVWKFILSAQDMAVQPS
jgi:hypothetical protein